jgi:AcrR family transcriptional regulator
LINFVKTAPDRAKLVKTPGRLEDIVSTTSPLLGRPAGASGDKTRQRILQATMRCVADVGYSRATMREIARLADMTGGSLYHYFPNKSALILATYTELVDTAVPRLAEAAHVDGSVADRFMAVLDECDEMMRDHPFIAAFDRAIRVEGPPRLRVAQDRETMFTVLRNVLLEIVEDAAASGALSQETDADSAANAIYVLMRGLVEYGATAPADQYHATVRALKLLIRGALFDYDTMT